MPEEVIKFAATGGEVSPHYFGRSDLEKFDLALSQCENWFVNYHGGISTAPGTELNELVQYDTEPVRFYTFRFASNAENTYLIILGKNYIRFLQDGSYVLEEEKTVTAISALVFTCPAHGFSTNDLVKFTSVGGMVELLGNSYVVQALSADTFSLKTVHGDVIDTSGFTPFTPSGKIARVYTLTSPFATADLPLLQSHQIRDVVRFTHNGYNVYNLRRYDSTNWTITVEDFDNQLTIPVITAATAYDTGTYGAGYVINWVDTEGKESLASDYAFCTNMSDVGGVTVTWAPIVDAQYYNVYRTRMVKADANISRSFQVGFIGKTKGSTFVDPGITPDFSLTPLVAANPFADAAITSIDITASGSGYNNASVLTCTDPTGTGFIGYPIVSYLPSAATGPIVGVLIVRNGKNYTAPVFTISGGTGAVLSATISPDSGNNPSAGAIAQQRQIYLGTRNKPLTVFGSRPGQLSNFSGSDITLASDSYEHEVDSEDAALLQHLITVRAGILAFSPGGIWLLSGNNGIITPTSVQADRQNYRGSADVSPLKIETDIIYLDVGQGRVNSLSYVDQFKLYVPTDISMLASHLFTEGNPVIRWAYADEPNRIIYAVRQDGVILMLTLIKDQNIYAWARRTTQGNWLDVVSLDEGSRTSTYLLAERELGGRVIKTIERVMPTVYPHVEEAFCVDCGLQLSANSVGARLKVSAASGEGVTASSSTNLFRPTDVGKIIRGGGGGKMKIVAFVSATKVLVDIIRPITELIDNAPIPYPRTFTPLLWTLDAEITTIYGLSHLEGVNVDILADGNVITDLTVIGGKITLPQPASRVIVGLRRRCVARNLPLNIPNSIVENKRKLIPQVALRVKDTRALEIGTRLDDLYLAKSRQFELMGEPNDVMNGMVHISVAPEWDEDGQVYFVQNNPLPATILGYILSAEVGDDPS